MSPFHSTLVDHSQEELEASGFTTRHPPALYKKKEFLVFFF